MKLLSTNNRIKQHSSQINKLLLFTLIAAYMLGCSDDKNNNTSCDCHSKQNCTQEEIDKCETEAVNNCDCSTKDNCTQEEIDKCETETKNNCNCETGINCSDEEMTECGKNMGACGVKECPDGESCVEGICIDTSCKDIQCPENTQCRGGECIELACLGIGCEDNQICQNGECVSNNCKDTKCSEGYTCNNSGQCETDTNPIISIRPRINYMHKNLDDEGVVTHENSSSPAYFDISLDSLQPTKEVKFTIESSDTKEIIVQTPEITFTPDNWKISQSIMLVGVPDHKVDGDQEVSITITSISEDPKYNGFMQTMKIINKDDDFVHLVVTPPEESVIYEGAFCANWQDNDTSFPAEREFSIRLGSIPKYTVYVSVKTDGNFGCLNRGKNSTDHSYCPLSCSAAEYVKFDETNWNQDITFKISDWDSNFVDNSDFFDINFELKQYYHNDPSLWDYDSLEVEPLKIFRIDNDKPRIIPQVNKIETWDNGLEVKVCGKLSRTVSQKVMVTATVDTNDVVVDTSEPQEMWGNKTTCFTLHGVKDGVIDSDIDYHVTLTPQSTGDFTPESATLVIDAVNHNTDIPDVYADINNFILEEGQSTTIKVKLSAKPTGQVNLIPELDEDKYDKIYSLDKTKYTIEPDQWDTGVDIQLSALDDPTVLTKTIQSYAINFKSSSEDAHYIDKSLKLYFKIKDINTKTIKGKFQNDIVSLSESQDGSWYKYNLTLDYQPINDIDIDVYSSDSNELKIRPSSDTEVYEESKNGILRYRINKNDWNKAITFEVSPVNDGYYDGDKKVYINVTNITHKNTTSFGPYTVKDIHSSKLSVDCAGDALSCAENRCFISLHQTTSEPVTVNLSTSLTKGFEIIPKTITFDGTDNTTIKEFKIKYTKSEDYDKAYLDNTLNIKTSGPGVYNNYEYSQKIPFYSRCRIVYDSRTSENAANTGLKLPPGMYKLEVAGASGGSYFNHIYNSVYGYSLPMITTVRGDGAAGSYASGVLTLDEETMVYPWYGYGGKNGYLTSIPCDPTEVNCGGQGNYSGDFGSYTCDGGGASDIRIGQNDIYHRVIVGAGGNGDGNKDYAKYWNHNTYYYSIDDVYGTPAYWTCEKTNYDIHEFGVGQNAILGGAGGGGWYGGKSGSNCTENYYNEHSFETSYGGRGACGFVYRKYVFLSNEVLNLFKLDNKYMLTEVSGYDAYMPDDVPVPELYQKALDGEDGIVVITALPK